MDFLNDIDNAETMEIPVREVKKSKPAKKAKKPVSEEEEMEQLIDSMQPKKNAEDIIPREKVLTEDEEKLFTYFAKVPGLKEQILDTLCDGDFQNIIDHQPGRKQNQYAYQDTSYRHKGKTCVSAAILVCIIGNTECVKQNPVVLDIPIIFLQFRRKITDNALKILFAVGFEIGGIEQIFVR